MNFHPVSAACTELLARAASYHPLYGGRLANHLPMVLIALDRMGASPIRLETFFEHYHHQLIVRTPDTDSVEPTGVLGKSREFERIFRYFDRSLKADGPAVVLRKWLPVLMPGVGASAFHALIRLAYGIDAEAIGEIAAGLAYWAAEYQPLGSLGGIVDQSLEDIATSAAQSIAGQDLGAGIIIDRMVAATRNPRVRTAATQPTCLRYEDIAAFALGVYDEREDFTLLHLVTASHAYSFVAPYLDGNEVALRQLWNAILMAYLSTGTVTRASREADGRSDRTWGECIAAACDSLDDHVVKLTYTAWRLAEAFPDPRYLRVASRKVCGA